MEVEIEEIRSIKTGKKKVGSGNSEGKMERIKEVYWKERRG